jgi:hypothetical protein
MLVEMDVGIRALHRFYQRNLLAASARLRMTAEGFFCKFKGAEGRFGRR